MENWGEGGTQERVERKVEKSAPEKPCVLGYLQSGKENNGEGGNLCSQCPGGEMKKIGQLGPPADS